MHLFKLPVILFDISAPISSGEYRAEFYCMSLIELTGI